MWPSTQRKEAKRGGCPALDPDYPLSRGFNEGRNRQQPFFEPPLEPMDAREDLLLLQRVWRCGRGAGEGGLLSWAGGALIMRVGAFVFVGAGRLEEAADLCQRCGQAWRAASLLGGDPWHADTTLAM
jgi:hypothetical protein